MGARDEVGAANENFVACYRVLARHCVDGDVRERPGVFAFTSGVPVSLFNGLIVTAPAPADEVATALEWLAARSRPYRAWVVPELAATLADTLRAYGLELDPAPYPGMVLRPVPAAVPPADGIEVVPIDPADLDEFLGVGIEAGVPPELGRAIYSPGFAGDPGVQLFCARLDGRAVGTSVAIQSERASGIVAVGTLPAARRRGVGAALTWAAVAAGAERGHDTIVLQASPMGYSIYAAMGFRTVVSYAAFAAPRA
jgi:GNAT superfamily N-acetyltransferase